MKNRRSFIKKSSIVLTVGSVLFPIVSIARRKDVTDNTVVTLYVDTAQIAKSDVNQYCNFGQPSNIANEDFTIEVKVGDTVTWQAVSANAPSTDIVNVASINHEGGKNVFGKNVLKGDGQSPERVTAQVLHKTAGSDYKYKISFKVYNNGVKRNGTFHIDPKIRVS
jgi:hypothetical protein